MEIYFDPVQKKWCHRLSGRQFVWGKGHDDLPRLPFAPSVAYKVRKNESRVGPLIGILTSAGAPDFTGNRIIFKRIHRAVQNRGGIVYVFTPVGAGPHRVQGYVYDEASRTWLAAFLPYPDVVYNRIPSRLDENRSAAQNCISRLASRNIPLFNGGFLNKWEMYTCLVQDAELERHLPKTRLVSQDELKKWLAEAGSLYLKPCAGQKGDGIQTLTRSGDDIIQQKFKETNRFSSFESLWEMLSEEFKEIDYLMQPKIHLNHHKGKPYDFRLIVQKQSGRWQFTGAGARLAGEDAITTHVPKGGELLAISDIQPACDLELLSDLCLLAAKRLEACFPPLDELSFDIGRDVAGHYWLFEANAKPMAFDEPEIETKRMEILAQIFYEKSGFQ